MKLLVISQYFHPENFRINDLVSSLVERGHQVTVLTGQPNYPSGSFFPGYSWLGPRSEIRFGATLIRVPLFPRGAGGRLNLAINYLSFMVTACWGVMFRLRREQRFDAVFVFEPSPVTVGIPAVLAGWRYKAPVLFWVLDLWPDSLSASGAVHAEWLLNLVGSLTSWIYSHCALILVQSRAFIAKIVSQGVSLDKIRYFPNWGEPVFAIDSSSAMNPMLRDLPPGFRILFAGNIGEAQDFPSIIAAAAQLRERADIIWVIVGDGRKASWAREEVQRLGLERTVHFLGQHPLETMPTFFAEADAFLVSLKYDPIFALTVPGKLQSYLASGKPVVAMLDGEGARVVTEAAAGLCCAAGDAPALADAVQRLAGMSHEQRMQMGANGKAYFAEHFSRERVIDQLQQWLIEVTAT